MKTLTTKTMETKINNSFKRLSALRIKRNKIEDTQCREFKSLDWRLGLEKKDYNSLLILHGQVRNQVIPSFTSNGYGITRFETLPEETKNQIKEVYINGQNIYYIPFVGMAKTLKDAVGYLKSL